MHMYRQHSHIALDSIFTLYKMNISLFQFPALFLLYIVLPAIIVQAIRRAAKAR